jgi:hypothetical protein
MGYVARERIFIGYGPNLDRGIAVFSVDDLTEDECRALEQSVQKTFDDLHKQCDGGPWSFELGPSAADDLPAFINLKIEWNMHRELLDEHAGSTMNPWQSEISWFHDIALEHANVIRSLRDTETPTAYLQCDVGGGFETFECVSDLTWDELDSLETLLGGQLYDVGIFFRVVRHWHAEREPVTYVQARLSWKELQNDLRDNSASETVLLAREICSECIAELKALRSMPVIYGSEPEEPELGTNLSPAVDVGSNGRGEVVAPKTASEELRANYRDPDNYWRNVWLYEQRAAGMTNPAILAALDGRAGDFALLDSDNALRTAIESIAEFHGWPILKGRPGRPKANGAAAKSRSGNSETPQ